MNISNKISKTLYVAKAFAILSVVAAHMSFSNAYPVAEIIRISLGQIGVIVFFITSGFFYQRNANDSKNFWRKKLKTLVIPWIIFSTIVFVLSEFVFGQPDNLLIDFIKNFFGVGTIYWYMTIVTILMLIFKSIVNNEKLLYMCIGITIVSFLLSAFGIIKYTVNCNQYLNVFNWMGFFALGILIREKALFEKIINKKLLLISFIGLFISIVIAIIRRERIEAYIDITSIFVEIFGFVLIFNLSSILSSSRILVDIGKKSFFIYLMHIQVVGIINSRLPYNPLFFILRPFTALVVCYIIAILFKFILDKLKLSKFNYIFGLDR